MEIGPVASKLLWEAEKDPHPEIARRAPECLKAVEETYGDGAFSSSEIWRASARWSALRVAPRRDSPLLVTAFASVLLSPLDKEDWNGRGWAEDMLRKSMEPLNICIAYQLRPADLLAVRLQSRAAAESQDESVRA